LINRLPLISDYILTLAHAGVAHLSWTHNWCLACKQKTRVLYWHNHFIRR